MKSYVMLFPWMYVIFCWVDCGNMTEIVFTMGERICTP
jgi:hypothetical protein